jgi:hypothetical protein
MRKFVALVAAAALAIAVAAPGAQADPPDPQCANGQFTAAAHAPNFGQFIKHGAMGLACVLGVPPGEVVNNN